MGPWHTVGAHHKSATHTQKSYRELATCIPSSRVRTSCWTPAEPLGCRPRLPVGRRAGWALLGSGTGCFKNSSRISSRVWMGTTRKQGADRPDGGVTTSPRKAGTARGAAGGAGGSYVADVLQGGEAEGRQPVGQAFSDAGGAPALGRREEAVSVTQQSRQPRDVSPQTSTAACHRGRRPLSWLSCGPGAGPPVQEVGWRASALCSQTPESATGATHKPSP